VSHVCHFHHIRDRIGITSTLNSYLYNPNSPHIQHITVTSHIKTVSVFIGNHVAFLVFLAILLDFYHILKLGLSVTKLDTGFILNDAFTLPEIIAHVLLVLLLVDVNLWMGLKGLGTGKYGVHIWGFLFYELYSLGNGH